MERENETVENLFEDSGISNEESNAFADLPPVAPVNYEEETIDENSEAINNENSFNPFAEVPPVAPENVDENDNSEEKKISYEGLTMDENKIESQNNYDQKEIKENPNAKVVLNQEKDEEISSKEMKELKNVKLKDNTSLTFVLFLGIIFLIAIFIIPVISKYI